MMWDAGLRGTAEARLGYLLNALLRNCRYLAAIGMHAQGMTVAQAQTLFQQQCYQDAGTANQQAARGTFDPGYLNYTLGKLQILKLRADYQAQEGANFSLKKFHDEMLKHGMPPIRLLREIMLKDKSKWAEVL